MCLASTGWKWPSTYMENCGARPMKTIWNKFEWHAMLEGKACPEGHRLYLSLLLHNGWPERAGFLEEKDLGEEAGERPRRLLFILKGVCERGYYFQRVRLAPKLSEWKLRTVLPCVSVVATQHQQKAPILLYPLPPLKSNLASGFPWLLEGSGCFVHKDIQILKTWQGKQEFILVNCTSWASVKT